MRQTSIFAYHSLTSQKINRSQKAVYDALKQIEPATNRQVSEHSGIPINVVTPRMGENVKKGCVESAYYGFDRGRRAIFWQTKEDA